MQSLVLASLFAATSLAAGTTKRGIIGVDNIHSFEDQATLLRGNAPSWAYNYAAQPGNATWFGSLEFVPQLWGGDAAASFEAEVLANVPATKNIFAFNEPDGDGSGQATMTPSLAATIWKQYVEPLRAHNISLGSPSCTGTDSGIQWLQEFYGNCTSCHIDFVTTHWYGNYAGLAAHLGNMYAVFNATPIWITEMGIDYASLEDTESMFNSSISWLDGLSWVDRYAWFGDFRSEDSNLGPNVTMLNDDGGLTTIGVSYLYTNGTNFTSGVNTSSSAASKTTHAATATVTTALKSGSVRAQSSNQMTIASILFSICLVLVL